MNPRIGPYHRLIIHTHLAGAGRVIGAFHRLADKGVYFFVTLHINAGLDFGASIGVHRRLADNLTGQAHTITEAFAVILVLQVVELDARRLARIV